MPKISDYLNSYYQSIIVKPDSQLRSQVKVQTKSGPVGIPVPNLPDSKAILRGLLPFKRGPLGGGVEYQEKVLKVERLRILNEEKVNSNRLKLQSRPPASDTQGESYTDPINLDFVPFKIKLMKWSNNDFAAYIPLSTKNSVPEVLRSKIFGRDDSVKFLPSFTSISETISPQYNEELFFSRTQPLYKFSQTGRTLNVEFDFFSESEDDITTMLARLNFLDQLCYPGSLISNVGRQIPLIRFSIGNLFIDRWGIIDSLSKTYDPDIWINKIRSGLISNKADDGVTKLSSNQTKDFYIPLKANVSLTITLIHGERDQPSFDSTFEDYIGRI